MNDPKDLLRQHGLQVTAQRLAVLRAVTARPHCTTEQVADEVRAQIGAASLQAVYDALKALTGKGLIRRLQPPGMPALYDPRVGDNHHHAICRSCGLTTDVDCAEGAGPCLSPADSGYRIDETEILYWGICPRCIAKTTGARDQRPRSGS